MENQELRVQNHTQKGKKTESEVKKNEEHKKRKHHL